ncbi:hypothetical protein KP509_34G040300 [Ceratopteris richardii]|uniref:Condensin-2 complex subunit H2 n=1 Tax=Ceratopteris richardii TaxID=49495 RepID=A0A8T2QKF9_CERRI|nr:hypothetical protein KP509_34G040300 [Ceratopteris richardii]KAH7284128.1 hypothetical protein KP509_34G040300 [Ceratopteris richardii]KAH7284130.1 hypothetical protein KP509_34G040300 [Ceratopteris richardii]KAH7284132.1 hypothetical protein KP509_34G040300 [Ceratopteris richardii]KAH7284133.1 hypothetical protein KP509_34G040300 [Ceratopteris richardii]
MEKDEEPRYVHLLQPNRDLAANWAVDVARELEAYLAGLSLSSVPDDGGHDSFNFAEAALLIQGSIQVYSRKVEYLYALVLQALEFIANKKQTERGNSSIQENGKDADIVEDEEDDFLNLDDVPEERNIDIIDEQKEPSCVTPAVRPPACLLVVEGDSADLSGDAGELASYQISTSSLHKNFLLLDPCDAKFVDEYWRENTRIQESRDAHHASNAPLHRNFRIGEPVIQSEHANQEKASSGSAQKGRTAQITPRRSDALIFDSAADHGNHDDGGLTAWMDTQNGDFENHDIADDHEADGNIGFDYPDQGYDQDDNEDEMPDPWAPLNPHMPGTLPVVPFRKGRPNTRRKSRKPCERSQEPLVYELGRIWQSLEILEREAWRTKQSEEPPPYEKLRSSFTVKRAPLIGAEWTFDRSDNDSDHEDSRSDDGFGGPQEAAMYQPEVVDDFGSQNLSQQTSQSVDDIGGSNIYRELDDASQLEELCQAQLDAVLKKHSESEKLTELANRVGNWNKKIEKSLAIEDTHPPFDIHAYGERILNKFSFENEDMHANGDEKPFTCIVAGLEKHEVARTFAALLQLVNNGNVALDKGSKSNVPKCFTAEHPFTVKLLSSKKHHEEMLQYRAPSSRKQKGSARKKGKSLPLQDDEFDENLESCFKNNDGKGSFSPTSSRPFLGLAKGRRLSGRFGRSEIEREVSGGLSITSPIGKSNTPEGKRRRRRQSLKSVQVRLAG